MKFLVDTHTHTVASGHAYSTILENAEIASQIGLKMFAVTDHGPAIPGVSGTLHIGNLHVIPDYLKGVRILKGVEANIIDFDGRLDVPERLLNRLDLVIASFHDLCIEPGSVEENTRGLINAMNNPFVDIIAHPGNPIFAIDIPRIVQCAIETNTLIEINNSSFVKSRAGSSENCKKIALEAKKLGARIAVGSDAHFSFDIGRFDKVEELLEEVDMPEQLILNTSVEKVVSYLNCKGRNILL